MKRFTIVVLILTVLTAGIALANSGYVFQSYLGGLREYQTTDEFIIFDTREPLTSNKTMIVGWGINIPKSKANLTDLGLDLKERLLKIFSVADVYITYRVITIRRFRLDTWAKVLPEITKVLDIEGIEVGDGEVEEGAHKIEVLTSP